MKLDKSWIGAKQEPKQKTPSIEILTDQNGRKRMRVILAPELELSAGARAESGVETIAKIELRQRYLGKKARELTIAHLSRTAS